MVVLFVDLDDFKSVNDALGHGVGDQLLRDDRRSDPARAVGSGDTPARLGGDEFAILLEDRGGVDRAHRRRRALLDCCASPCRSPATTLAVLASVGVAVAAPGMTTTSLLRDADIAMYEAKRAGKGQIQIFDPAMRLVATKHLEYRSELGAGDRERTAAPRVHAVRRSANRSGHRRRGVDPLASPERGEMLAERVHPDRRAIGADRADRRLGARTRLPRRPPAGSRAASCYVSVNVSARPDPPARLRRRRSCRTRRPYQRRPVAGRARGHRDGARRRGRVGDREPCAELREDRRPDRDRRLRHRLLLAVSYLQRFPVDLVKIDRRFDRGVRTMTSTSSTLARMILQMATALGVTSVAEGIERPSQLRELRALGCDIGQGYLLSRPLEAAAVVRPTTRRRALAAAADPSVTGSTDAGRAWSARTASRSPVACRRRCSGSPANSVVAGHEVRVLGPCDGPPPESFVTPLGDCLPTSANGSMAPLAPDPSATLRTIRVLRRRGVRRDPPPRTAGARAHDDRRCSCTGADGRDVPRRRQVGRATG